MLFTLSEGTAGGGGRGGASNAVYKIQSKICRFKNPTMPDNKKYTNINRGVFIKISKQSWCSKHVHEQSEILLLMQSITSCT